jgi:hypothetical protein
MLLAEVEFGQAASTTLGRHIVCSAVHIRSWGSRQEFATTLCYKVFPSAWNGDKGAFSFVGVEELGWTFVEFYQE